MFTKPVFITPGSFIVIVFFNNVWVFCLALILITREIRVSRNLTKLKSRSSKKNIGNKAKRISIFKKKNKRTNEIKNKKKDNMMRQ